MVTLTQELARAAAQHAGNARMRRAGRKVWNQSDYQAASKEFNRLVALDTAYTDLEGSLAACRVERKPRPDFYRDWARKRR